MELPLYVTDVPTSIQDLIENQRADILATGIDNNDINEMLAHINTIGSAFYIENETSTRLKFCESNDVPDKETRQFRMLDNNEGSNGLKVEVSQNVSKAFFYSHRTTLTEPNLFVIK